MVKKWINIECIFMNKWVLPIHNEINEAYKISRINQPSNDFYEYAMSISIRIDMIYRLFQRITKSLDEINEIVMKHEEGHINTIGKEGYVLYIEDELKLDLLIDIDSFLFEINSCCELIGKYIIELYKAKNLDIEAARIGKIQSKILRSAGQDISWFRDLDVCRNFFIHNGAPYLAIDVTEDTSYNLIIMKENLKEFEDPNKYITLTTLVRIRNGYLEALFIIQEYLRNFVSSGAEEPYFT